MKRNIHTLTTWKELNDKLDEDIARAERVDIDNLKKYDVRRILKSIRKKLK